MKPDPRTLYDMVRSGDVERVGRALEPRGGMHHVSRPVNSIRQKVAESRAIEFWPADPEARAGYVAYYTGADITACPHHAAYRTEDWQGWRMGWSAGQREAEDGVNLSEDLCTAPGSRAQMRRLEGHGG